MTVAYGTCQLFCGEMATVVLGGFAIDEGCLGRIRDIARDAKVPFPESHLSAVNVHVKGRLVQRKHKPGHVAAVVKSDRARKVARG